MKRDAPNFLHPRHFVWYTTGLTAGALAIAFFMFVVVSPTPSPAAAPTFSGGGPASGATAIAVDASVTIVSDVALAPASLGSWTAQTSGTANDLTSTSFIDASTGWAVGASGIVLKTTDGGTSWTAQTSGTANDLTSTSFIDASTGWAVGASGTILKTSNGGTTWSTQTSGTSNNLRGVTCTSTSTCYAVGGSGSDFIILKTTDGGSNWSTKVSGTNVSISSVGCSDANTCWFAKNGGAVAKTSDGGESNFTLQTSGTSNDLNGIAVIDENTAYIVGASGEILKTTDGGSNWTRQTSNTANNLNGITCLDANTCWAVGASGTVLYTADGGTVWGAQTSNTSTALNGVHGASATAAWVVGDSGVVHTFGYNHALLQANSGNTQAGAASGANLCTSVTLSNSNKTITCTHADLTKNTWYTLTLTTGVTDTNGDALATNVARSFRTIGAPAVSSMTPPATVEIATDQSTTVDFDNPIDLTTIPGSTWEEIGPASSSAFNGVVFANESLGWVVGDEDTIAKTTDGGATWTAQTSGTSGVEFTALSFPTETVGYVVGDTGTILKTSNGGDTWTAQTSGTGQDLKGIACLRFNRCWAVGGSGVIVQTTDGGVTWTAQTSGTGQDLLATLFLSDVVGWAAGNAGTLLKTTDGGATWTAQTSGTANVLYGIHCTNVNTCWAVGDGVILGTTNGGTTWASQYANASTFLKGVYCITNSRCWAVGTGNTVAATANGGATWTVAAITVPAGAEQNLFGVTALSATSVKLVGSGGAVFKTSDGGSAWQGNIRAFTGINGISLTAGDFIDTSTGFVGGVASLAQTTGFVLQTTDGGYFWTYHGLGTTAVRAIDAVDASVIFAAGDGGNIYATADGGTTWTSSSAVGGTGAFFSIRALSTTTAVAVGAGGKMRRTTDAWSTSSDVTPESPTVSMTLRGIDFGNASNGIVVGSGRDVLTTSNGGTTWTVRANVLTSGHELQAVKCIDENTCWGAGNTSGTSPGVIYKTTTGGTAWTDQTSGTPNAFAAVYATDANTVYAAGNSGALFATTDGGTTWTAQTSGTTGNFNALTFISSGTGWAVGGSSEGPNVVFRPSGSVTLRRHVGYLQGGAAIGSNLCASATLGNDGDGNSNRRVTCSHADLAPGTWYTITAVGGSGGITSTSGDVLASTTTRTFRTAFASAQHYVIGASELSSLVSEGVATIAGTQSAATSLTFQPKVTVTVSTEAGTASVTIPAGTAFTPQPGSMDASAFSSSDAASSVTNASGTVQNAAQFGIPDIGITSSDAITVSLPVPAAVSNGIVLDVYRSTDTDFSDNTTKLTTCTVSASFCEFSTTALSYFIASHPGAPLSVDTTPPSPPTSVSASASLGGPITITWVDPSDADLSTIRLLLVQGQQATVRGVIAKGIHTFDDPATDLTAGQPYTFAVQAEDSSGNRSASASVTVTPSVPAGDKPPTETVSPADPTSFTAVAGDLSIALSWVDPPDSDLASVTIARRVGTDIASATTSIATVPRGAQTYLDTAVAPATTYAYIIQAVNRVGNRSEGISASATTTLGSQLRDTVPPNAPTNVTGRISNGAVVFSWVDPADADLAALRVVLLSGTKAAVRKDAIAPGTETFTDLAQDLSVDTSYTFAVEAIDRAGNRSPQATVSVMLSAGDVEPPPCIECGEPPPPPPPIVDQLPPPPCQVAERTLHYLFQAFSLTQKRNPEVRRAQRDLGFLCSLLTDPRNPVDPTKVYPEYRNLEAEALAIKNFVNFFRRPPSRDFSNKSVAPALADRDWWAVKYMAYHFRLIPTYRDITGERACLKIFFNRTVVLYKDGVRSTKGAGHPPQDLWDYDFVRSCTYSGAPFLEAQAGR